MDTAMSGKVAKIAGEAAHNFMIAAGCSSQEARYAPVFAMGYSIHIYIDISVYSHLCLYLYLYRCRPPLPPLGEPTLTVCGRQLHQESLSQSRPKRGIC